MKVMQAFAGASKKNSAIERSDIALVDQRIRNFQADHSAWKAAENVIPPGPSASERAADDVSVVDPRLHRFTLRLVGRQLRPGLNASSTVTRLGGVLLDSAKDMLLFEASERVALAIAHELPHWLAAPESHAVRQDSLQP